MIQRARNLVTFMPGNIARNELLEHVDSDNPRLDMHVAAHGRSMRAERRAAVPRGLVPLLLAFREERECPVQVVYPEDLRSLRKYFNAT